MSQRQQRACAAQRLETFRGAFMKPNLGWTVTSRDLDPGPEHAARMAGPQRLHGRFLCLEARRKRRGEISSGAAIGNLFFSEHPLEEPVTVAFDHVRDALDLGRVETHTYNLHVVPNPT